MLSLLVGGQTLGATVHVSNDLGFKEIRKIEDGRSFIYIGNNDKAPVEGVGTYQLKLEDNKVFKLEDCLFAKKSFIYFMFRKT